MLALNASMDGRYFPAGVICVYESFVVYKPANQHGRHATPRACTQRTIDSSETPPFPAGSFGSGMLCLWFRIRDYGLWYDAKFYRNGPVADE